MIAILLRRLRNWVFSFGSLHRAATNLVSFLARLFGVDLLALAHRQRGILRYENFYVSGEEYVVQQWLPRFLAANSVADPILFDVGANIGEYATLLAKTFPQAAVHSFEPLPSTFALLQGQVSLFGHVHPWNVALSSQAGTLELWAKPDNPEAIGHSTLYPDVLTTQFTYKNIVSTKIVAETLDSFCAAQNIPHIHFLKIDTEGHEMDVLQGAKDLLEQKSIYAVQFEFNEMHIISRVFLRDFVQLFVKFNLYRLLPGRLEALDYSSREEIFLMQNLLAVRKECDAR